MTKREFLQRLERCLAGMDASERSSMVEFYEEQIDDRMDDGMAEEAAVASLESPEDIAANILAMRAETARNQAQAASPSAMPGAAGAGTDPAADQTGASGTTPTPARKKSHPVLRGIGRSLLGFLEVLAAIILIPIAICLVAALVCVYIALWACAVALGASSLGCAAAAVILIITLFAAPPATAAVGVATAGLIVGALGLTVLLAILAYAFGKLLVYLVIWIARPIRRARARRRAEREATTKQYPSMPVPPMPVTSATTTPAQARRGFPLWGKFAIVSVVLALIGAGMVLGAVAQAGSFEGLVRQAGSNAIVHELTIDADQVTTIDLSAHEYTTDGANAAVIGFSLGGGGSNDHHSVGLGVSPDDKIHVLGSAQVWGVIFSHGSDYTLTQPTLDGQTIRLEDELIPGGLTVQNPFASFSYGGTVRILIPQGWQGTIICDDDTTDIQRDYSRYLGNNSHTTQLEIDGPLNLRAGSIFLTNVSATSMELEAAGDSHTVSLDNVAARESITVRGAIAYLGIVEAGGGIVVDPGTRVIRTGDDDTDLAYERSVEYAAGGGIEGARDAGGSGDGDITDGEDRGEDTDGDANESASEDAGERVSGGAVERATATVAASEPPDSHSSTRTS